MKIHATNKIAYFDYSILEEIEAGIVLRGWEVKSIKAGNVSVKESYVKFHKGEVYLTGMHVTKWKQAGKEVNMDEEREKKLLLSKKEIEKMIGVQQRQGYSVLALKVYSNKEGKIKVLLGLGKGKKKYDKRAKLKEKDQKRQIDRELAGRAK